MKTTLQKDTCSPVFTAALFATAETWKPPESLNRQMDKEVGVQAEDRLGGPGGPPASPKLCYLLVTGPSPLFYLPSRTV